MPSPMMANAIIEIPASTNKKFVIDTENDNERIIDFLPYLANYGFIPSTFSKSDTGVMVTP